MSGERVQVSEDLRAVFTSIGVGAEAVEVELTRGRKTTLAYGPTPSATLAAAYAASTKEPGPRPSYYGSSVWRRVGEFWREGPEPTLYPDADVRVISNSATLASFQLRIPRTDPETGTDYDLDGDRALERIEMYGGEMTYFEGGLIVFRGFVRDREDMADSYTYHPEQWRLRPDRLAFAEETS